jgi:hypothetical protein
MAILAIPIISALLAHSAVESFFALLASCGFLRASVSLWLLFP